MKHIKKTKITRDKRTYRIATDIVEEVQRIAVASNTNESRIIEQVLGIALGLRERPKPIPVRSNIKIA